MAAHVVGPMRGLVLLAGALLSGCLGPEPWGESEVTAHGSEGFQAQVRGAVERWDAALLPLCGRDVLRLVPSGGRPVVEVPKVEWSDPSELGSFDGDRIEVRGGLVASTGAVLAHELGHALGLDHVSIDADPLSVMHPVPASWITGPSERDARLAAQALGCL